VSTTTATHTEADETLANPWPVLWALCLGFFMILVDMTIVTVATPAIISELGAGVNEVIWVTSAYLLAYAVPVLITGRLGDRFGPKRVYLTGLAVFTVASLWCGLADSIGSLVAARTLQGLGASMMTPQTMAVITRIFPAARRGSAMALWGSTAGVATLVGPLLGGLLVDRLGWEWIFFINVPVGIVGFLLAVRLVPRLSTREHSFDWLGVALSGAGMFLLVFGIQEGNQYAWGHIAGPFTVWRLIIGGLLLLAVFVWWQAHNTREPLMPLTLFGDRNFSVANIGVTTLGFTFTAMGFPLMLYAQAVRGFSPAEAGMLMAPMAIPSIVFATLAGRLTDRVHPRWLTTFGFGLATVSLTAVALLLRVDTPLWQLIVPLVTLGLGSTFLWGPLATTANRNLPLHQAGAGAGVYNTTRQVGSVLGSAVIALLLDARLSAHGLPTTGGGESGLHTASRMPTQVAEQFSEVMSQTLLAVPAVLAIGLVAVLFFERPQHFARRSSAEQEAPTGA
jgi:EmrB/QacA subfamily drug resistance transporter